MKLNKYGKSHIPMKFTWEMTEKCNLNCSMCYSIDCNSKFKKELSTEQAIQLFKILEINQVLYLFLDGGEPLLREDFFYLLKHSTSKFCTWVSTNGTLIHNKEARLFKKYNIGTVFVSLHGHNDVIHEKVTQTPNSFKQTVSGIEALIRNDVSTMTTIQVSKLNIDDIEQYILLCKELQIPKINFLRPYRLGKQIENFDRYSLTPNEYKYVTNIIEQKCKKYNIEYAHSFGLKNHNCCKQAFSADVSGNLMNCPYLRNLPRLGNVFAKSLLNIWNSEESLSIRNSYKKPPHKCTKCNNVEFCSGGCMAGRIQEQESYMDKDPICWIN